MSSWLRSDFVDLSRLKKNGHYSLSRDEFKLIDRDPHWYVGLVPNCINRDKRTEISKAWIPQRTATGTELT